MAFLDHPLNNTPSLCGLGNSFLPSSLLGILKRWIIALLYFGYMFLVGFCFVLFLSSWKLGVCKKPINMLYSDSVFLEWKKLGVIFSVLSLGVLWALLLGRTSPSGGATVCVCWSCCEQVIASVVIDAIVLVSEVASPLGELFSDVELEHAVFPTSHFSSICNFTLTRIHNTFYYD
jgi:hypothetical protein